MANAYKVAQVVTILLNINASHVILSAKNVQIVELNVPLVTLEIIFQETPVYVNVE
jgi:hypothetical protein